ncbi:MAG: endonuclease MutS2 [Spirochaetales bacterium]|nr:endonuclease MutS2 [Spirochaetales bacterium]
MTGKSLDDLEFAKVRAMIASFRLSEEGGAFLAALPFTTEQEELLRRQGYIAHILGLIERDGVPSLPSFPSIAEVMESLDEPNPALEGPDLLDLARYLQSSEELLSYLLQEEDESMNGLTGGGIDPDLISLKEAIRSDLDESGSVREDHPRLEPLYRRLEQVRRKRASYCSSFIDGNRSSVQSDVEALRDGRLVIPIKDGHKHTIKGYISSVSASGQTVFMEPFALVDLNNSVLLANNAILVEAAKILHELALRAKQVAKPLRELRTTIGKADGWYSLSRWAHQERCTPIRLDADGIRLLDARHPLLKNKAIPITIILEKGISGVVLSGPNAGGKTVTVKTFGLFSLLNQYCGYLPVREGSALPLFDRIFTDIGDEQSIEKELSTFSGHMSRLAEILNHLTPNSLVILDELGSGTDPLEGSALAQAILSHSLSRSALTLVTSHHGVLKEYAYSKRNIINAAMEFDEVSGKPTFRIIPNVIGRSHALATAKAMGLPQEVLREAEELLGSDRIELSSILERLEEERKRVEERSRALKRSEERWKEENRKLELKALTLGQRERLLREEELRTLVRFTKQARQRLESLVTEIREGELTGEKTKAVKTYLAELDRRIEAERTMVEEEEEDYDNPTTFEVGTEVLCGSSKREGTILAKQGGGRYLVSIGSMRMSLKDSDLFLPTKRAEPAVKVSYTAGARRAKREIDVRGFTLEEALEAVERNIEAALLNDLSTFGIIHGYGDGILSRGIAKLLETHRSVVDFRFALPEDGGMGKTYVFL